MKSYYEILHLKEGAPKEEIRRAFCKLAKKFHPDVSRDNRQFIKILDAYRSLTNEKNSQRLKRDMENRKDVPAVIPKKRISYAVSLKDIAKMRLFNPGVEKRGRRNINLKDYDVCVHLTPKELKSGAVVELDVPAHVICPLCRGDRTPCSLCSDRGYIMKAVPIQVEISKALNHGDIFEVSLRDKKPREYAFFVIKQLRVKIEFLDH